MVVGVLMSVCAAVVAVSVGWVVKKKITTTILKKKLVMEIKKKNSRDKIDDDLNVEEGDEEKKALKVKVVAESVRNVYIDSPKRKNKKEVGGLSYCEVVNDYERIDDDDDVGGSGGDSSGRMGRKKYRSKAKETRVHTNIPLSTLKETRKDVPSDSSQTQSNKPVSPTMTSNVPKKSVQQLKQEYLNNDNNSKNRFVNILCKNKDGANNENYNSSNNNCSNNKSSDYNSYNNSNDIGMQMTASMFQSGRPPIEGMDAVVEGVPEKRDKVMSDEKLEKGEVDEEETFRFSKATIRRIPLLRDQPLLDDRGLLADQITDETTSLVSDHPSSIDDDFEYDDYISALPDSIFNTDASAYTLTWTRNHEPWVSRDCDF